MEKQLLSAVAIVLTFAAFLPYIRSIFRGTTKPHVFSWVIWGSVTFVVGIAQLSDRGGAGAWPIVISGLVTMYVAALAYTKRGEVSINRLDWAFLVAAFTALPAWFATSDPLWAVLILTTVDVLGFGPMARKVYQRPFTEPMTFIAIMVTRNLVAIAALENYSLTTVLFPAATAAAAFAVLTLIFVRRRQVPAG